MNEVEPAPNLPAPAKSAPGIAQSIGLCVLFYGAVFAVYIALYLFRRLAGVSLDKISSMLVEQLIAWPLATWAGLRMSKCSFREAFPLSRFPFRIVPALVIASVGITILLIEVVSLIPMSDELKKAMEEWTGGHKLVVFLSVVVMAPLAEEAFFRGLVLRGYLGRYSVVKAVWASALLFAVFHMNPWQAVAALPLGLGCAWLVLRTGSLIPGILCHATLNFSTSFLLPPLTRALGYDEEAWKALEHVPPSFLAIGGAMAIGGGLVLWRQLAGFQIKEYHVTEAVAYREGDSPE